jgi:GTP-binding protein EngB required for normal cell division
LEEIDFPSNPDLFDQFDVYCSKDGVAGNGALMRLAPVPLFFYRDPEKAVEYSGISGKITHGDKKAYDACRYYGALIVGALQGLKKEKLLSNTFYDDYKQWFGNETLHSDIMSIAQGSYKRKGGYDDGIRGKGYIVSALEAALWAFWNDNDSFEKGVLDAVNLGDDTDTTAAIYGQLAGAYYGYKKLPGKWREVIYAKNFVLCVSNWIAHEGDQWYKRQTGSAMSEPLINSNPDTMNSMFNKTSGFKQSFYSSNGKQSKTSTSIEYKSMVVIDRKAIDTSGRIGSFYNACHDCILESPYIHFDINKNQGKPTIECTVRRGDQIGCQNLLQFVGFNDELRLSLVSNIVSPSGIGSVIEYPYLIDECTRIFYYFYSIRQEIISFNLDNIQKQIEQLKFKDDATHIITGIDMGIGLIVILRLKSNQSTTIDDKLNHIKDSLSDDKKFSNDISLNDDDIISTHIYSNIDYLTKETKLIDVIKKIYQIKSNISDYRPLNYILHFIDKLKTNYIPLKPIIVQKIEQHLSQFSWINKMSKTPLDHHQSNIINNYLKEQLEEVEKRLLKLNEKFENEKIRLQKLILNIRYGKDSRTIQENEILNEDIQIPLKDKIDDFIYFSTSLKEKVYFIEDLKRRNFIYENANKYQIQQNDDDKTMQDKFIQNNHHLRFICSNDTLKNNNSSLLEDLFSQLSNEKKSNKDLHLIYVDFTYSTYELDEIKIFPLNNKRIQPNEYISLLDTKRNLSDHSSLIDDKTTYILLLGKSGVGKSTLINTFKNYLKCNRDENIPNFIISFVRLITIDSEDRLIQFGNIDPNEDYDHPDQSITQQCKLYNFKLDNNQKICFIDTPGFGKTNNQSNDDITMQHILSRIITLTHLNAVCVLIESNDQNLDDYQICLTKLFHCLGNNLIKHILFCFTKTLSGNINNEQRNNSITQILQTFSTANIVLNENIIFEFDSTFLINSTMSHRFIQLFPTPLDPISEKSWQISKNGWNRLLNYIRQRLRPYSIEQGLQKAQSARIEINQLIRPILETVRNNFRNIILSRTGHPNDVIELQATSLLYPSAICYACKRIPHQYKYFLISSDFPHEYRNSCHECSCPSEQHFKIEYRIEFKYLTNQIQQRFIYRKDLLHICVNLSYFILEKHHFTDNDLFLIYINKMIDEERSICGNFSAHAMNLALYNELINFKQDYQRQINLIKQKHFHNDFDIDDLIEKVKQIPSIKIQLDAARKIQETSV